MKKLSILRAASLGAVFAVAFGAAYLNPVSKAQAKFCIICPDNSESCGSTAAAAIEGCPSSGTGSSSGGVTIGGNSKCQTKRSCSSGYHWVSSNNTCAQNSSGGLGSSCSTNSDCSSGFYCDK